MSKDIRHMTFGEIQENLAPGAAGSEANQQRAIEAGIRVAELLSASISQSAERLDQRLHQLANVIDEARNQAERTEDRVYRLNRTLLWLNWILVVFTLVQVIVGVLTLVMIEDPVADSEVHEVAQ